VIVPGLEVAASSYDPQFFQDGVGRLYVAMPAGDAAADRRAPYEGEVLRFTQDGTVPWSTGQNSPTLASALPYPTASAVDAAGGRVWLAGRDGRGPHLLAVSTNDPIAGTPAASSRVAEAVGRPAAGARALSVAVDAGDPTKRFLFSVSADGVAERQSVDGGGVVTAQRLDVPFGTPVMFAANGSTLYLVTARADAGGTRTDVYLLSPAP
jgi:hypothetical protein